jgi:acetolactate synthase I/III small subunit
MANKLYEITVYTENQVGLLNAVSNIFTRRSINIESLRVFPSGIEGIHRFTVKARASEDEMYIVIRQIEKKVDVLKAFCYVDDERHERELAVVRGIIEERMKEINK